MLQNLKIDIIYHETPSDFEFEFNLGGCCHCRVLNNSTSSPKELIGCLSKAVGRSRIIIVVGNLNQPNGLYLLISKAIGRKLINVSAEEYGIIESSNTTIIEDSLPLVSSDGLLAGCIIESGPQSIILLPDEKILRKDVAENLVFQYVSAVSRTPDTDSVIISDSKAEEKEDAAEESSEESSEEKDITNEEDEIPLTEAESLTEEVEPQEENVLEEISDTFEQKAVEDEEVTESESDSVIISKEEDANAFYDIFADEKEEANKEYVYAEETETKYDESNEYDDAQPTKDRSTNILIWIIIGLMFIIIGVLAYMLIYIPMKNGINITDYVKQIFNQ